MRREGARTRTSDLHALPQRRGPGGASSRARSASPRAQVPTVLVRDLRTDPAKARRRSNAKLAGQGSFAAAGSWGIARDRRRCGRSSSLFGGRCGIAIRGVHARWEKLAGLAVDSRLKTLYVKAVEQIHGSNGVMLFDVCLEGRQRDRAGWRVGSGLAGLEAGAKRLPRARLRARAGQSLKGRALGRFERESRRRVRYRPTIQGSRA